MKALYYYRNMNKEGNDQYSPTCFEETEDLLAFFAELEFSKYTGDYRIDGDLLSDGRISFIRNEISITLPLQGIAEIELNFITEIIGARHTTFSWHRSGDEYTWRWQMKTLNDILEELK